MSASDTGHSTGRGTMPTQHCIKIFGLPRTCTIVVEVLVKTNFRNVRVFTNFPCWKHGRSTIEGARIHGVLHGEVIDCPDGKFLVCLKNPYNWLRSFNAFETPKRKQPLNDLEFLSATGCFHYKDMNPIDAYCEMNRHWVAMFDDPSTMQVIRHEEVLSSQAEVTGRIGAAFGLQPVSGPFREIRNTVRPFAKVADRPYTARPHGFSPEALQYINHRIDHGLVKSLGYEIIEP